MHLNRISIVGRLTRDPIRTEGESPERNRTWGVLAVNRPRSESADFVPFVCWGKVADAVANHCGKGKVLILDGSLRTRREQDESGKYTNYFEVNCQSVGFGPDAKNVKPGAPSQPTAETPLDAVSPEDLQRLLGMVQQMRAKQEGQQTAEASDDPFAGGDIPF